MKFKVINGTLIAFDEYSLRWIKNQEDRGADYVEMFSPLDQRTKEQNSKSWAMYQDFAEQVEWGGQMLTKEDWKDLLACAFEKQTILPGLDGGLVALPPRTSHFIIPQFSDFIECVYAYGTEYGVNWSEKSIKFYEDISQSGR